MIEPATTARLRASPARAAASIRSELFGRGHPDRTGFLIVPAREQTDSRRQGASKVVPLLLWVAVGIGLAGQLNEDLERCDAVPQSVVGAA